MAYNQERYIRDAIEGAFSQTYSPLEIILSDDCSKDQTFDIMEEEKKKYNGPHKIVLNKNNKNMGIGGHINIIMKLAQGDLIIAAAGDDISLPERTEIICKKWISAGKSARSLISNYEKIDMDGLALGAVIDDNAILYNNIYYMASNLMHVPGFTHAWDKKVFDLFGPMGAGVVSEDVVIPFRSLLLGDILHIDKILVKFRYQVGISNEIWSSNRSVQEKWAKARLACAEQYLSDYKKSGKNDKKLLNIILLQINRRKLLVDLFERRMRVMLLLGYLWRTKDLKFFATESRNLIKEGVRNIFPEWSLKLYRAARSKLI